MLHVVREMSRVRVSCKVNDGGADAVVGGWRGSVSENAPACVVHGYFRGSSSGIMIFSSTARYGSADTLIPPWNGRSVTAMK